MYEVHFGGKVVAVDTDPRPRSGLKQNSLSGAQVFLMVIAFAAPMTGLLGTIPQALVLGNGIGVPGAIIAAGLLLVVFSAGFTAMSSHVPNSGAFFSYIRYGMGKRIAGGAGMVAIITYLSVFIALLVLFGAFSTVMLDGILHQKVPWWVCSIGLLAVVQVLGTSKIDISAGLLSLLVSLELGILMLLAITLTIKSSQNNGLSWEPFYINNVFSGNIGIAFMFSLLLFSGFEATALYSEECSNPKRSIPTATYAAVIFIMVFDTFVSWSVINGYGTERAVLMASKYPEEFWFIISQASLGTGAAKLMRFLLLLSIAASSLTVHNSTARYFFSIAREGYGPKVLGTTTGISGVPRAASFCVGLISVGSIVAFAITGADPLRELFNYLCALAAIALYPLQAGVCLAIIKYLWISGRDRRLWHALLSPSISAVGLLLVTVIIIRNLPTLAGINNATIRAFPWFIMTVFLLGTFIKPSDQKVCH